MKGVSELWSNHCNRYGWEFYWWWERWISCSKGFGSTWIGKKGLVCYCDGEMKFIACASSILLVKWVTLSWPMEFDFGGWSDDFGKPWGSRISRGSSCLFLRGRKFQTRLRLCQSMVVLSRKERPYRSWEIHAAGSDSPVQARKFVPNSTADLFDQVLRMSLVVGLDRLWSSVEESSKLLEIAGWRFRSGFEAWISYKQASTSVWDYSLLEMWQFNASRRYLWG